MKVLYICYDTAMRPRRQRLDPNTVQLLKHIGAGVVVIGVVALLVTGVWYGTRISALTITEVVASGGETIEPVLIEQKVQEKLEGTYLGLVPRRFAWLYPEAEIFETVGATERLFNVSVTRESGTKLLITYDEYVPFALWCHQAAVDDCLFINAEGYAFGKAPKLTGGSLLRFVTPGREAVVGEVVAEAQTLSDMQELVQGLENYGWFISQVEIDQVGDVFLQVVGGGELKVSTKTAPAETVENLLVVLSSDEFKDLKPGSFQYVDLRFGEKIFVNEEPLPAEESASSTTASTSEVVTE